jgi:hypothetical protein
MKLALSEKQYNNLLTVMSEIELEEQAEPPAAEPEKGTSDKQAGGQGYPAVGKWESGVTRGPGNQVGVTKWADVVGAKLTRSKANQLKEQKTPESNFNFNSLRFSSFPNTGARPGSDYFASVDSENRRRINILQYKKQISKYIYKEDDGEGLFMNLMKGQIEEALLDLRSVTFTTGGMVTQTVIEVIFSETVVVPIAVESLNAAILLNDIHLYIEQGDYDPEAGWRVLGDLLLLATRGLFKFSGKKLKAWAQSPAGKQYLQNMMSKLSSFYGTIQKNIEKIPSGKLKNYVLSKLPNLQLLKNILNKVLKTSPNVVSKIPKKIKKAIVAGLLTYITAEGLDRLLHRKVGTTREEMASLDGIGDETVAKIGKLGNIAVPIEEINADTDLNILVKKKDLKAVTIKIIELYKDRYPCLSSLYQKNQFTVIAATEEKDIFKINGVEYYGYGAGIFDTKTNQEWEC